MCHRVEEGLTQLQRLVIKMPLAAEVCYILLINPAHVKNPTNQTKQKQTKPNKKKSINVYFLIARYFLSGHVKCAIFLPK